MVACSSPAVSPNNASDPSAGRSFEPYPSQPTEVPWPTAEWTMAGLPPDVDPDALDAAVAEALNDGGDARVRAILIVHRGALAYERYSPNPADGPDVIAESYSLSKSVLSAFIGILVRDQVLDVHAPAPVPEWHAEPDDPRAAITVEHMLHMATGIPWIEDPSDPDSDNGRMGESADYAAYAASLELVDPPGSVFDYSSGTSTVLARIVGEAVGSGPDDTRAFMDRELFERIGMAPVETEFDPAGTWVAGWEARATARGFAKFGLLYVRGGAWDDGQVLPADWVRWTTMPSPANPEYGAHWWLDPHRDNVLLADGAFGQFIAVDPAHDVVVVQLGADLGWDGEHPLVDFILDAFADVAIPR
jgi:CubicO group peptidase (beta-lactamase class C family)